MSSEGDSSRLRTLLEEVSLEHKADVLLYSGELNSRAANDLINTVCRRTRAENLCLIIRTPGGDAGAAYKIGRALQQNYQQIIGFVESYCKSAGTLLILGTHELVMGDRAELGPIDVQVYKPDELGERSSGLTHRTYLEFLHDRALEDFEQFFLPIRYKSALQISTHTAAEIATNLVVGLMEPIYAQIDPHRIGESERAMQIAARYGERLQAGGKNVKGNALSTLLESYPDHGFVIDIEEARLLFNRVRRPQEAETTLLELAHPILSDIASQERGTPFAYLEDILREAAKVEGDASGTN